MGIYTQPLVTMSSFHSLLIVLILALLSSTHSVECQRENAGLTVSTHDLIVIISQSKSYTIGLKGALNKEVNVLLGVTHADLVELTPNSFVLNSNITTANGIIRGVSPGHVEITATTTPGDAVDATDLYLRVSVANSLDLITVSVVFGWLYFIAWSISFYPQIYLNFKRKSVVGYSFDYLSLNLVGYVLYTLFNVGLYIIPAIQAEYFERFPRSLIPVQVTDVFFAIHGIIASLVIAVQCFCYERGDQRVTILAKSFLLIFGFCVILTLILSMFNVIQWLDFLYICSYIKLSITLIKYCPQAYMNYRRKSTTGWSIDNILLDFAGGMLSILEMMVNAYNYDDWASIFGDPTKFGLGVFTVVFDVLFLLQHYVFYGESKNHSTEKDGQRQDDDA